MTRKCEDCEYADIISEDDKKSIVRCLRYPPQNNESVFMDLKFWCGEFKKRGEGAHRDQYKNEDYAACTECNSDKYILIQELFDNNRCTKIFAVYCGKCRKCTAVSVDALASFEKQQLALIKGWNKFLESEG